MATQQHVIFGHWKPKFHRHEEIIAAFGPVITYAREKPDEVLCYYLLKEDSEDIDAEILVLACFRDIEAYDRYRESAAFSQLDATCRDKDLLATPQRDQIVVPQTGFPYRSTCAHVNPHVVIAHILYKPGTRAEGIEHWKDVASSVEKLEPETSSYWFLADSDDANVLWSFERYRDKQFLWDVHVPSDAITQNKERQKYIRVPEGLKLRFWKQVADARLAE